MKQICFLISVFSIFHAVAQDSIRYDADFEFYDGLYLQFEDFRNDNPIPMKNIISAYSVADPMILKDIFESGTVRYRDRLGEERTIRSDNIWGYSWMGSPYVKLNAVRYLGIVFPNRARTTGRNEFGKIIEIGPLCLVQVNVETFVTPNDVLNQTGQFFLSINSGNAKEYNLINAEHYFADDGELLKEFLALESIVKKK